MKRYRDVTVSAAALDSLVLVHYIETFAKSTEGWEFSAVKSAAYRDACGIPSCCLVFKGHGFQNAALHFAERRCGRLYLSNVVPLGLGSLSKSEYNGISSRFARDLRARVRVDGMAVRVVVSKDSFLLRDAIPSKVAWKHFESYVKAFPQSHHPADIRRLDQFICAVSRYARRPFDANAFELLLHEELKWPTEEAQRCRTRVEIGLEVLKVSKRF